MKRPGLRSVHEWRKLPLKERIARLTAEANTNKADQEKIVNETPTKPAAPQPTCHSAHHTEPVPAYKHHLCSDCARTLGNVRRYGERGTLPGEGTKNRLVLASVSMKSLRSVAKAWKEGAVLLRLREQLDAEAAVEPAQAAPPEPVAETPAPVLKGAPRAPEQLPRDPEEVGDRDQGPGTGDQPSQEVEEESAIEYDETDPASMLAALRELEAEAARVRAGLLRSTLAALSDDDLGIPAGLRKVWVALGLDESDLDDALHQIERGFLTIRARLAVQDFILSTEEAAA